MFKPLQDLLKRFFDEKTSQDIVSKTVSQAFVIGLLALLAYISAVLYFTYGLLNKLLNTERKLWSQFTGDITLVLGLLIAFVFIFSIILYFRLKFKISDILKNVQSLHNDLIEIKDQNISIERGVEEAVRNIGIIPNHFRVLERNYTHRIKKETEFIHQRKFKLKTLENNLQVWKNRFHWTGGSENVTLSSENKEQNLIREISNDFYEYFQIIFPQPLLKNQDVDISLNWQLGDPQRVSKPFFGATIDEQTEILRLTLIYNESIKIKNINQKITYGAKTIESQDFKQQDSCVHTWEIVKPDVGCRYTISWDL